MDTRIGKALGSLALVMLLVGLVGYVARRQPAKAVLGQAGLDGWDASGVITTEEIALSPARMGRVAVVHVAEGDQVIAGQELISLDVTLLEAEIVVAEAQLAAAQAGLREVEAGARPGRVAIAEAQLEQAQVTLEAALEHLADAKALRDNPQELQMLVAVGEAQVEAAQHRLQGTIALKDAAEIADNTLRFLENSSQDWPYTFSPPGIPEQLRFATYDWWKAWAGVGVAQASLQQAQAQLAHWRNLLANPQQLNTDVAISEALVERAEAGLDSAQAQLASYRSGATEQQLAAARSRVAEAQAALTGLRAQRAEMVLLSPIDGRILSVVPHPGEIVAPGATLLSIADLAELRLTVYIAENRLSQLVLNQLVQVAVDAFPQRTFEGHVVYIADSAEYTPRNVATKEERVSTVYGVDVVLPNPEGLLKPGMSAEARFLR